MLLSRWVALLGLLCVALGDDEETFLAGTGGTSVGLSFGSSLGRGLFGPKGSKKSKSWLNWEDMSNRKWFPGQGPTMQFAHTDLVDWKFNEHTQSTQNDNRDEYGNPMHCPSTADFKVDQVYLTCQLGDDWGDNLHCGLRFMVDDLRTDEKEELPYLVDMVLLSSMAKMYTEGTVEGRAYWSKLAKKYDPSKTVFVRCTTVEGSSVNRPMSRKTKANMGKEKHLFGSMRGPLERQEKEGKLKSLFLKRVQDAGHASLDHVELDDALAITLVPKEAWPAEPSTNPTRPDEMLTAADLVYHVQKYTSEHETWNEEHEEVGEIFAAQMYADFTGMEDLPSCKWEDTMNIPTVSRNGHLMDDFEGIVATPADTKTTPVAAGGGKNKFKEVLAVTTLAGHKSGPFGLGKLKELKKEANGEVEA